MCIVRAIPVLLCPARDGVPTKRYDTIRYDGAYGAASSPWARQCPSSCWREGFKSGEGGIGTGTYRAALGKRGLLLNLMNG